MNSTRVRKVVVVVPAHDEEELLGRCLSALALAVDAATQRGIVCTARIVLDACTDESARVASAYPFPIATVDAAAVGRARAHGVAAALAERPHAVAKSTWIVTTDADSVVPPHWITSQIDLAERGADLVVGTVRPDFADLSDAHRQYWLRTHQHGSPNGHVHGANLGIRASTYLAVGGFQPIAEHEDVELVERARILGASIWASDTAEVLTSGRFVGRTPGGYAGYLSDQSRSLMTPASGDPIHA